MAFLPVAPLRAPLASEVLQSTASTRCRRKAPRSPHSTRVTTPSATATNPPAAQPIAPAATDDLISELQPYLSSDPSRTPSELLSRVIVHLADSRGMARLALVEALGVIGRPAVPHLLASLQSHPNPVVRRSSAKALAKIPDSAALSALLHSLVHDPDTVTRSSCAGALARMGPPAIPALLTLIADPDVSFTAKGHATWAVAFMQDASAALLDSLRHPSVDVRIAVVSALGAAAIGDALPAMGAGADDDWGEVDVEARQHVVEALSEALNDPDPGVKAEAATAIANAGCKKEAGRIADMLGDEDIELRRCAALALLKLGDVAFIERLREREHDENEDDGVRNVARLAANNLQRAKEEENDDDWD